MKTLIWSKSKDKRGTQFERFATINIDDDDDEGDDDDRERAGVARMWWKQVTVERALVGPTCAFRCTLKRSTVSDSVDRRTVQKRLSQERKCWPRTLRAEWKWRHVLLTLHRPRAKENEMYCSRFKNIWLIDFLVHNRSIRLIPDGQGHQCLLADDGPRRRTVDLMCECVWKREWAVPVPKDLETGSRWATSQDKVTDKCLPIDCPWRAYVKKPESIEKQTCEEMSNRTVKAIEASARCAGKRESKVRRRLQVQKIRYSIELWSMKTCWLLSNEETDVVFLPDDWQRLKTSGLMSDLSTDKKRNRQLNHQTDQFDFCNFQR